MSNCKTIAICNQKGGVGKTTTTVNLGVGLAMQGKKVLVASLAERAEKVRGGGVDSSVDNMLKITNDGRKLALDQRMLNDMLPDFEGSKINACVDNIYRIWEENADKKSAQLVFCDLSTPKNDGTFSVYNDIRKKLIERGIPENEVKHCIKKSLEYIGWLFGLSSSIIDVEPFNDSRKKMLVSVIKKELSSTFDDYKKLRLSHMLKVLTGIEGDNDGNEFVYGVDNYYYIFERMIDSIFGNVDDISKFNPKSNWHLKKDGFSPSPSSELRPDTILVDKDTKTAYILDSKYYRFGTTGLNADLPESTSIQKQITYGEYIKQNHLDYGIDNIRSAFLLPYNSSNNKFGFSENLEYIGYSSAEWKDNTEEHQIIYAFLIDLKHTIATWNIRNSHDEDIYKLIESIEEEVNNLNANK